MTMQTNFSDATWLYRRLSDAVSGTPTQVLLLDLARHASDQACAPTVSARWLAGLSRWINPWWLRHWYARHGVRGLEVFRPDVRPWLAAVWAGIQSGVLVFMCVLAGGVGAGFAIAALFLLGLIGLMLGCVWQGVSRYMTAHARWAGQQAELALQHADPAQYPPEGATTLELIAIARGLAPDKAHRLAQAIRHAPDAILTPDLCRVLCLVEPSLPTPLSQAGGAMLGTVAGFLPGMLCLGAGPSLGWALLAYLLSGVGLVGLAIRHGGHRLMGISRLVGGAVLLSGLVFLLAWTLRHVW
ncbi:hypothetical protein HNQ59_000734 [Chitinivorax tropicus]|uniref:Uncharacterized protein n=1 Tax=Chitinivorax tropicus TaxID=714531 RepID=A0A840MGE1_9PROT|nr:VIT1/CCC1 transporter family protein [Chitinivorax tropicus]MBB5017470.1 hypothetical protein [Chitinivorax tropicus]